MMRLPTWEELRGVEEQLEVLEFPLGQSLFVVGPPGSGKTVLAIQRAQMVALNASSVSLVTYNRMLRRLLALLKTGSRHVDIRTMHSFVGSDYTKRTGELPPSKQYIYDWNAMHANLESSKKTHPSKSHIVVDEGQDLPQGFFEYASRYVARTVTVFADEDQASEAKRTRISEIKFAAGLGNPIILSKNHRNTPEISRLAEHFPSGMLPVAEVMRAPTGELPRLIPSQGSTSIIELVSNWFNNRSGTIGVIVNDNNTGRACYEDLCKHLPKEQVNIYTTGQNNENSINVLEPGVTVLNKASVKGQEFDTVFILELEKFIPCNIDVQRRAMYMVCTRARDHLFLVYDKAKLSAQATATLPGADILDRT